MKIICKSILCIIFVGKRIFWSEALENLRFSDRSASTTKFEGSFATGELWSIDISTNNIENVFIL